MEQKSLVQQPTHLNPLPKQVTYKEQTQKFIAKLKYFLAHNAQLYPHIIQCGRTGYGFALKIKNHQKIVNQLLQENFNMNLQKFRREAKSFGFTVRTKNSVKSIGESIILLYKQKIFDEKQVPSTLEIVSIQAYSESGQEEDDFPQDQQVQSLMKKKEQKGKLSIIKPFPILNKVMSEGNSALPDWKKSQDASIEVKLQQQDNISHLFASHKKDNNKQDNLQVENSNTLADRSLYQKQNYERCSKIIDSTIIQFLEAHRSNKISQQKEHLMNNIAEIYDILSNSIENIAGVGQLFGARESNTKKQQIIQENLSSGFKSICQD